MVDKSCVLINYGGYNAMYDLIDKKLKNDYIVVFKYMFIIWLSISLVLGVLGIFYNEALAFFVIFAIITLVFFIKWNKHKYMYGKKLLYANDVITIYNHKNLKINEFKLVSFKSTYMKIAFDEYPRFNYRNCLVLYKDFEPYKDMEYRSYWNDPNIIIVQNPELVDVLRGNILEEDAPLK